MGRLVRHADTLVVELLGPLGIPRHPFAMARFGLNGLRSATSHFDARFEGDAPKALLGGAAAHAMLPLDASSCAPRPRRPAAVCTACAGSMRPGLT
jgi:hypothetical protein